jgi:uracil-DNA glycosylase family 4
MNSLFKLITPEKEDIQQVMKEVRTHCTSCRLSLLHPTNPGLIYRGNPLAEIACIAEAPGDKETEKGIPLVGKSGMLFEKWMEFLDLDTKKEVFISNVVHCQPPKDKIEPGKPPAQRNPDATEVKACWGMHTYRVLKAMPNLKVVWTMGLISAAAILGGEPTIKTVDGKWFESSLLPGVAVFCTVHPSYILREPSMEKDGVMRNHLINFKREFLTADTVTPLAQGIKQVREAQHEGLF